MQITGQNVENGGRNEGEKKIKKGVARDYFFFATKKIKIPKCYTDPGWFIRRTRTMKSLLGFSSPFCAHLRWVLTYVKEGKWT